MGPKDTYEIEHVSLKEHLETVIRIKFEGINKIMEHDKEAVKEAMDVFTKTNDIHLDKLNHAQQAHERMITANISTDKFDGFVREVDTRFKALEAVRAKNEGETKISDWVKLSILGLVCTGLGTLFGYLITKL